MGVPHRLVHTTCAAPVAARKWRCAFVEGGQEVGVPATAFAEQILPGYAAVDELTVVSEACQPTLLYAGSNSNRAFLTGR